MLGNYCGSVRVCETCGGWSFHYFNLSGFILDGYLWVAYPSLDAFNQRYCR